MKKRVLSVLIAVTLIFSLSTVIFTGNASAANDTEKLSMAKALYSINLFKGYDTTGANFGLTDVPTREQALVFQIRVLGEEAAALAWKGSSPYTDVPSGNGYLPYIGYATDKGYTKGIGGGKFGFGQAAEAKMLTTFVLRGMGYSDTGASADFTYDKSIDYGRNLGICDNDITTTKFTRGDAVTVLYRALGINTKGSGTLASKLIGKGQFTQAQYEAAKKIAADTSTGLPSTLVELKTGNTHSNANNFGLAATDGSYIYYTVPASKRIDRMNLDGTNVQTLTQANAQALNIMNGWLYYSDNTNKSIVKISLDGTSKSTVKSGVWPVYMQVAENGWIYFINRSDGNKLCRVRIDGTSYDTVTEIACGEFYLFNDYIVVEVEGDGNKLYWISANDFTRYDAITNLSCDSSTYYNGRFYFANGNDGRKYYSIKPDGTGLSKLRNWYTGSTVMAGGKLYFCGGSESNRTNGKLYVQNVTTGADSKLLTGSNLAYNISVVGNYAFYTKFDSAFYAKTGSFSTSMRMVKIDGTGDKAAPTPSGMVGDKVDPTSVTLDKTTLSLAVGEKYDLTAKLAPTNSKISLTWSSSAPTVASVGSSGAVTGLKSGTATITVKTHNGKTATCKVTVTAATLPTIKGEFDIVNLTGKRITELYMTTSNTTDWGSNLISGGYIEKGYTVPFEISFNKSTKYDIMVKYSDGTTGDFRGLSFANATADGGTIVLQNSSATIYPLITVPVTFVNMTGKSLTSMFASSSLDEDWGSNLLSGSLANNGSVKIDFPMTAYDTKFDMLANFSGGKFEFAEMDFGSLPTSGATLYLYIENNIPKMSRTKPTVEEPTRDVTVTFKNASGKPITDFYSTSSKDKEWGSNLISEAVANAGSFQVVFPVSTSDYLFDFKVIVDGTEYSINSVDFSAVTGSITCSFAFDGSSLGLYQS